MAEEMLTRAQVQRYAVESGLRDMMIAEKEVVLTYLLELLAESRILERLAFKGGTCLRKMFIGTRGRFSTDLDFTSLEGHGHEDIVLSMMTAFERPFHGIRFSLPDDNYYETRDSLSWGINPVYSHHWNPEGQSEIKIQISRREIPSLVPEWRGQCTQSYFRHLPFAPTGISCLALPEIIAEKIRACCQRSKARDIYDLSLFALRPLDQSLIRRLVVIKLWQAGDAFDPTAWEAMLEDRKSFDWDDLGQLVHKKQAIDMHQIAVDCARGFAFLADMTTEEKMLARDRHRRERALQKRLLESLRGI